MKTKKILSVILCVIAVCAIILSAVFGSVNKTVYEDAVAAYDAAYARYQIAHKAYLEDKDTYLNEDRRALQQADGENILYIDVRGYGIISIMLYPEVAPVTVNNFKKLAGEGFYDFLTFHRVIDDFMIQGGDPKGDGTGGSGNNIKGEFTSNGVVNNLSHRAGIVSMARSQKPNSASSQFFIVEEDSPHLDGNYAAFGKVTIGMDIVHKIASVATDENDMPETPIYIRTVALDIDDVRELKEPTAPEAPKVSDYFLASIILASIGALGLGGGAVLISLAIREEKAVRAARLAEAEANRRAQIAAAKARKNPGKKK